MHVWRMSFLKDETIGNRRYLLPAYWIGLSILILAADYLTGPYVQFPILYVLPVLLASWYSGFSWGLGLSLSLSLFRFCYATLFWSESISPLQVAINSIIRICVLSLLAFLAEHAAKRTREIKVLKGLLPICCFCKKIRNPDDTWVPLEKYIMEHSNSEFTHSYCPECVMEQYGIDITKGTGPQPHQ
jgi:hypothetical protein